MFPSFGLRPKMWLTVIIFTIAIIVLALIAGKAIYRASDDEHRSSSAGAPEPGNPEEEVE